MSYTVIVEKPAQDHFQRIIKSGQKNDIKRFRQILIELENHPHTGIGNPEKLNPDYALELRHEKLKCNKSDIYIRKA